MQRPPSSLDPKEQCCSKFPDALSSYSLPAVMVPGSMIQALSPQSDTLSPLPSVASSYHPLEKKYHFSTKTNMSRNTPCTCRSCFLTLWCKQTFSVCKKKKTPNQNPTKPPSLTKKTPKHERKQTPIPPSPPPRRATENKSSGWFVVVCVWVFFNEGDFYIFLLFSACLDFLGIQGFSVV